MKKNIMTTLLITVVILGLSLSASADQKVFKFGIDAEYPPWTWYEKGEPQGFDIEIIKAIAKHNNLEYEFVVLPWETAVPALGAGKIDLLSGGMWITCERDKVIDFTNPYYWEHASIVVREDSDLNMGTALSCGAKLGALAGATNFEWIKELADNPKSDVTAKPYENTVMAIKDLEAGRIDAMHIDSITAHDYANDYDIKIIGTVFMYGETVFGVEEGDPQGLLPIFNEGFNWLWETGKFTQLWEKYMPEGSTPMGPLPLPRKTLCQ